MQFTHDTEIALASAAALVNTMAGASGLDRLTTVAKLDAFVREWQWTGAHARSEPELKAVRELRPRLRELWERDEAAVVELVNALLAEANALPRLVRHDGWGWHLHATPDDAPLSVRMAVEAAMAMVDVLRAEELARLRTCTAPGCADVFVDLSRNRSKRFCSATCGNRVAAAAYRVRRNA